VASAPRQGTGGRRSSRTRGSSRAGGAAAARQRAALIFRVTLIDQAPAFSPDRGNFNVIAGSRDRSNRDREEKQNKIYKLIGPNHGRAEEPRQSATPPARAAQRCDRVFALRAIGDARNATPLIAWSEWTACRSPSVAAAICFPSPATTRTNHHATLSLSLSPRPGALALCVGGCAPCQGLPPAAAPASALPPSSPSPPQSGSKS
jgi:hypothetical protein